MDNIKNNNSTNQDLFTFPRTLNRKVWEEYLGRELSYKEDSLFEHFSIERSFNKKMVKLYQACKQKNLYVPCLTELYGDCMFESLNYYNIGNNIKNLRLGLAHVMNIYKDYKNFFPAQEASLKELFSVFNEIHLVSCNNNKKLKSFHFYTYETMLQDLSNKRSWTLLPTQLILMVISLIYKAEITIVNNENGYSTVINVFEEEKNPPELKKVIIGQLGESHYLPLDLIENEDDFCKLFYNEEKIKFINWAKNVETLKYLEYEKRLNKNQKADQSQNYNFKELKKRKKNKTNLVNFE